MAREQQHMMCQEGLSDLGSSSLGREGLVGILSLQPSEVVYREKINRIFSEAYSKRKRGKRY